MVYPINKIQDSFIKFKWLTKTASVDELPSTFSFKPISEAQLDDVECRATEALVFQRPQEESGLYRKSYQAFFQSLLASAWIHGEEYPHLLRSHFLAGPKVVSYWKRYGTNYISQPHPLFSLHTDKPLELFCSTDFTGNNPPSTSSFQPSHNGIFERSFDQINLSGGCRRHSPFPFAHTLFLYSTNYSSVQDDSVALMSLFAQSAGHTVQDGFSFREHLRYPLSTQAIVLRGKWLNFYCYQLNTLDLSPKEGATDLDERVNIIWVGPKMKLYDDIDPGVGLVGFNRECAALLLQFLFNDQFRERPEVSGYDLLRAKELEIFRERKDIRKKKIEIQRAKGIAKIRKNELINKTIAAATTTDVDNN